MSGHDGLELVAAQIFGELVVVEALGAFDGLLQHLEIGIAPAAEIIAERVDAFGLGAALVVLEEIRGRRHQFRRRHPGLVIDDAVELRLELSLNTVACRPTMAPPIIFGLGRFRWPTAPCRPSSADRSRTPPDPDWPPGSRERSARSRSCSADRSCRRRSGSRISWRCCARLRRRCARIRRPRPRCAMVFGFGFCAAGDLEEALR